MNKVMLVGRLTRDPELRTLPSGKPVANFVVATNEFRGNGASERTEYHNLVAWERLAEICGQFLGKGQLVDVEGRLQTRQWDDEGGLRHWKTEVVVNSLEMLSGAARKTTPARRRAWRPSRPRRAMERWPPRRAWPTSRRRLSSRCSRLGSRMVERHPPLEPILM
jgi:single stranded DNA-binding protein (ssb)